MPGTTPDNQGTSTRPYLLRALHDWCTDNGFTPYVAVFVGPGVQVPMAHVKDNEIVLNIGFEATSGLKIGNETLEFKARFGGVSREIIVPVDHVVAIYARENGQGMAFPVPTEGSRGNETSPAPGAAPQGRGLRLASSEPESQTADAPSGAEPSEPPPEPAGPPPSRPSLKRVK